MGRAQNEAALLPVGQAEECLAHRPRAAGLFPELNRVEFRQADFLGADPVHFVADDALDLPQHAPAKRGECIKAGSQRSDQAGAEQQLVTSSSASDGASRNVFSISLLMRIEEAPRRSVWTNVAGVAALRSSAPRLVEVGSIDYERDRTVVHEFHRHLRPKAPALAGQPARLDGGAKGAVQRLRDGAGCCAVK